MRSQTAICIRWKLTGRIEVFSSSSMIVKRRIEVFVNLGKLYSYYSNEQLGVSRATLYRKNLFDGYQNDTIEILKNYVK